MDKTPEKKASDKEARKEMDKSAAMAKSSKKTGLIIGIVAGVIALAVIIGIIVLCTGKSESDDNGDDTGTTEVEEVTTKVVGSEKFGYVTVPSDWVEVEVDDDQAQYGSKDRKYFVSFLASDTSEIKASEWMDGMKAVFEQQEIKNTKTGQEDFAGLGKAEVISGRYDAYDRWLKAYIIETADGQTRYIAVEGPDQENEAFNIPQTFVLKK